MKNIAILILFMLIGVETSWAGKIITDSIYSNVLKTWVKYNVYLPTDFEKSDAHYPAIYLLHGLADIYTAWDQKGRMQDVADELMESGESKKAVVFMPNAGGPDTRNIPNGYFNMPGWNYEDFFFTEFMPQAEKKYRAGGKKSQRAIMGLSMGGGGSVVYAQRHPDTFSSCFAMSPWLDNKQNNVNQGKEKNRMYYTAESVEKFSAIDFVINADEARIQDLKKTRWYVDCGDDDFLFDLSVDFHKAMRSKGIKSELTIRNGIHNWEYWHIALRRALTFASESFCN